MKVIPTLSLDGCIATSDIKIVKIFEHFLASEKDQSNIFNGYIASLKFILDEYSNANDIEEGITLTLTGLYNRYFDSVDVEVNVDDNDDKESTYNISIDIDVMDEYGNKYSLSRSLENINSEVYSFDEQVSELYK